VLYTKTDQNQSTTPTKTLAQTKNHDSSKSKLNPDGNSFSSRLAYEISKKKKSTRSNSDVSAAMVFNGSKNLNTLLTGNTNNSTSNGAINEYYLSNYDKKGQNKSFASGTTRKQSGLLTKMHTVNTEQSLNSNSTN
jgi:hypothetical protein